MGRPEWESIETIHRADQRLGLGVPSFTENVAILTESQGMPLQHHAEELPLLHLVRMNQTTPAVGAYGRVLSRHCKHL